VKRFDAPITHRDMNQVVRCRMLERCEAIRLGNVPRADLGTAFHQIASDCGTLGDYEKGLHFVSLALQEKGDDVFLYNLRGMYPREDRQPRRRGRELRAGERLAGRAVQPRAAALPTQANYNQALARGGLGDRGRTFPRVSLPCAATFSSKLGRTEQARAEWQDAVAGQPDFGAIARLRPRVAGARLVRQLDQAAIRDRIRSERRRLSQKSVQTSRQGELPEFVSQAHADPCRDGLR
jgi:hypothetical protein